MAKCGRPRKYEPIEDSKFKPHLPILKKYPDWSFLLVLAHMMGDVSTGVRLVSRRSQKCGPLRTCLADTRLEHDVRYS